MAAAASGSQNVFYLAAARATDKCILASISYNGKSIDSAAVKRMLGELQAVRWRRSFQIIYYVVVFFL